MRKNQVRRLIKRRDVHTPSKPLNMRKIQLAGPYDIRVDPPTRVSRKSRLLNHTIKMEIPAELQERTNILFQELSSKLGKYSANEFVLMRTVIHFEDNESSVINPQGLMNRDNSSIEDLWDRDVSSSPADDPGVREATSNKDLYEILGQPSDSTFEANQDKPMCKRCTCKTCKKRLDRAKKKGKK
jgi:hypothetical protein